MKELEILVNNLKDYLAKKEIELKQHSNFNLYTEGALLNRQRDIESFEVATKGCEQNPFHRLDVINNFTKDADTIKSEIDKIFCETA